MKLYHRIVQTLHNAYSEREASALARWICEEHFGLSQTDILLDKDNHLSADSLAEAEEIIERLLRHEPIQYILGEVDFCDHRFHVGPGALIPRPETEELVFHILRSIHKDAPKILDIGTGTGCIALSLALALPEARVTAWDISEEALSIARSNGNLYPEAHVEFACRDILLPASDNRQWDIIVSNPPYICEYEAKDMAPNVLDYEPWTALFVPDDDPLLFYKAIVCFASTHLTTKGILWLEINEAFGTEIVYFIEKKGFRNVEIFKDLHGKDRMVRCEFGTTIAKEQDLA